MRSAASRAKRRIEQRAHVTAAVMIRPVEFLVKFVPLVYLVLQLYNLKVSPAYIIRRLGATKGSAE